MSVTTLAKTAQSNHDAPVMALLFSGLGLVGLAGRATRRKKMLGGALMLLVLMMTQIACGGGSLASSPSPTVQAPVTHTITVTAVSGTVVQSTIVSLTVN